MTKVASNKAFIFLKFKLFVIIDNPSIKDFVLPLFSDEIKFLLFSLLILLSYSPTTMMKNDIYNDDDVIRERKRDQKVCNKIR